MTVWETIFKQDGQPDRVRVLLESQPQIIKATRALSYLAKKVALGKLEKNLSPGLSRDAGRTVYPSTVDTPVRHCAIAPSVDALPEVLMIESSQPNALSWHTESEVVDDRRSLVVNDIRVEPLMTKLAPWYSGGMVSSGGFDIEKNRVGVLESASKLFHMHPLHVNRFRPVKEFSESEQFLRGRRKIDTRLDLFSL